MNTLTKLSALSLLCSGLGLFSTACSPTEEETGPLDLRRDYAEPAADELRWVTPDWTIPAYTEKQFCVYYTYSGPDIGITAQMNYQSKNGHHVTLFGTTKTVEEAPDGSSFDCTSAEVLDMASMEPIVFGGEIVTTSEGVTNEFVLPEGMAAKLRSGQRLVVQSHYVNQQDQDILVRDASFVKYVPADEVTTWAAPMALSREDFSIPANTNGYNLTFDVTLPLSVNVLYMGGHLHEWGSKFQTLLTSEGSQSLIYEVAEWEPEFRDSPMYQYFEAGAFELKKGDVITTSCTWDNDLDHALEFPQEMCVTFGMVYPLEAALVL